MASEMIEAGYNENEISKIREEVKHYHKVSSEIKISSGDAIDLKDYEPGMRHLIDSYIEAEAPETITTFENASIIEIIAQDGVESTINRLPQRTKSSQKASSETIENNVRSTLVSKNPQNPKFYEKMSVLLEEIIEFRKKNAEKYKEYLSRIEKLCKTLENPTTDKKYPEKISTKGLVSLYENLENNEDLSVKLDLKIKSEVAEGWRGNKMKERAVKIIIRNTLQESNITNEETIDKIFQIVSNQDEY